MNWGRDIFAVSAMESDVERDRESCSFYVTSVPSVVFDTDPEASVRAEFESIFRTFSENVVFTYLKSFSRVRVTYPDPEQSSNARSKLQDLEFRGCNLHLRPVTAVLIGSHKLELPEKTKAFLISPPASPPVGWEQSQEAPPTRLDYNLVSALASLQLPGEVQQLHDATDSTPGIVVVTPDNPLGEEEHLVPKVCQDKATHSSSRINMNALPRRLVQTSRPPLSQPS